MSTVRSAEEWTGAIPIEQVIAQERHQEFLDGLCGVPHLQVDGLETFQKVRPELTTPLARREKFDDLGIAQSLYAVIRAGNCVFGLAQAEGRHLQSADTFYITALSEETPQSNAEFIGRLRPNSKVLLGGRVQLPTGQMEMSQRFAVCMDAGYNVTIQRRLDISRPMRLPFEVITAAPGYNEDDRSRHLLSVDDRAWTCSPAFLAAKGVISERALGIESSYRKRNNIVKPANEY